MKRRNFVKTGLFSLLGTTFGVNLFKHKLTTTPVYSLKNLRKAHGLDMEEELVNLLSKECKRAIEENNRLPKGNEEKWFHVAWKQFNNKEVAFINGEFATKKEWNALNELYVVEAKKCYKGLFNKDCSMWVNLTKNKRYEHGLPIWSS